MSAHINKYGSAMLRYYDLFCFCEPEVLIYLPLAVPEGMLRWLTQISPDTMCLWMCSCKHRHNRMLSHNWPALFAFEWREAMHGRPRQEKYIYTSHCSKERKGRKKTGERGENERGGGSRVKWQKRRKPLESLEKTGNQEKLVQVIEKKMDGE